MSLYHLPLAEILANKQHCCPYLDPQSKSYSEYSNRTNYINIMNLFAKM